MQPAVQQILRGTVQDQGAPSGGVAINRAFLHPSAHASGLLTVLFASHG